MASMEDSYGHLKAISILGTISLNTVEEGLQTQVHIPLAQWVTSMSRISSPADPAHVSLRSQPTGLQWIQVALIEWSLCLLVEPFYHCCHQGWAL